MWQTNELGLATWLVNGQPRWFVDARGGDAGIHVGEDSQSKWFSYGAVGGECLPVADEQYIRRDAYHVNYPQGDATFALRMVFRPIEVNADRLVLETTVSIQTSLLDTHPKIDLDVEGRNVEFYSPDQPSSGRPADAGGTAPISLVKTADRSVAVLLGEQDSPFTTNLSGDSRLRLRLFGEFLEKGVIRRARPWIVLNRSNDEAIETDLVSRWQQLCGSPLPLS